MIEDGIRSDAPAAEAMLAEAVAAHLAVDVARANDRRHALAARLDASIVQTQLLIALAAAVALVRVADAALAPRLAALVLRPIEQRDDIARGLEAALSVAVHDLADALAQRPGDDPGAPGLRDALDQAARISLRLGQRAAT